MTVTWLVVTAIALMFLCEGVFLYSLLTGWLVQPKAATVAMGEWTWKRG